MNINFLCFRSLEGMMILQSVKPYDPNLENINYNF